MIPFVGGIKMTGHTVLFTKVELSEINVGKICKEAS